MERLVFPFSGISFFKILNLLILLQILAAMILITLSSQNLYLSSQNSIHI